MSDIDFLNSAVSFVRRLPAVSQVIIYSSFLSFSRSRIFLINFRQHEYKQTIVNKKNTSHKNGSMSNLLYRNVESYFALVKWIKIKGKPTSIFPSLEKETILNNNDRIFIKTYRIIINTTCLIISYLFTLLRLIFLRIILICSGLISVDL